MTDLETRAGWPDDLRFLLARYPRETWPVHANLGEMARFWLKRHHMFRELGDVLIAAAAEHRAGIDHGLPLSPGFAARLQFFLSQLEIHHQVEDHQYFPLLRAAEARLARGFEVLERDHVLIHDGIVDTVTAANTFLQAMAAGRDALCHAADRYAGTSTRLIGRLVRHLGDEEDLIVPLILDRGEAALGVDGH